MSKLKKGYENPLTGMIFWQYYNKNEKLREYWVTKEKYDIQIKKYIEYYKSPFKKEASLNWVKEHRKKARENSKKAYNTKKVEDPLYLTFAGIRQGAKNRNLFFDITLIDIKNLWTLQKGKCYYTGIDMLCAWGANTPYQVSVDRVNNYRGYEKDNIVLCCQSINLAKKHYSLEIFEKFLIDIKNSIK